MNQHAQWDIVTGVGITALGVAAGRAIETHRGRTVAVDLREDWPAALRHAGFQAGRPTAWLADGLLPFLPDDAKDSRFVRMHDLSAACSRIAVKHIDKLSAALVSHHQWQAHPGLNALRARLALAEWPRCTR